MAEAEPPADLVAEAADAVLVAETVGADDSHNSKVRWAFRLRELPASDDCFSDETGRYLWPDKFDHILKQIA